MGEIKVIPTILVHKLVSGSSLTGVVPVGVVKLFEYSDRAAAEFLTGETITFSGTGTGKVLGAIALTDTTGYVFYSEVTAPVPVIGETLLGGTSGVTATLASKVVVDIDTGEKLDRGRYREFLGLSDGGLVDLSVAQDGYRILNVLISLPGMTGVTFTVVDRFGDEHGAGVETLTSGNGYREFRNGGVLVAPGCKFKIVGTGTLTGAGSVMFVLGKGWGADVYAGLSSLGNSNRPPGMQRTPI